MTYAIIGLNCLMFFLELSTGPRLPEVVQILGFVPRRFLHHLGQGALTLAGLQLAKVTFGNIGKFGWNVAGPDTATATATTPSWVGVSPPSPRYFIRKSCRSLS